jgi:hypothetical protein
MPRTNEISAGAPGVPDATANARNSVESILSLTDEEIVHRFKSLSESEIRDLAPVLRIFFCMILIHNDKH